MNDTLFTRLAELGNQLEQTRKRQEMTSLLADFLQKLSPQEIPPGVRMVIGQVFPEWDNRALNIRWKALMTIVDSLVDASPAAREEASAQAVDGGEFVRILLERYRHQSPIPPPLTILEVFHILEEIAHTAGRGSRARKEELLRELMRRAPPSRPNAWPRSSTRRCVTV